jgi:hypothetical protein
MKALAWLACLLFAAQTDELLTGFRPSAIRSDFGTVSEVEFSTRMLELEAGALAHHLPHAMIDFRFAEPVWVIGYRTEILSVGGKTPRENYLCHTFLADQRVAQRDDDEVKGIYSDAFTPEVRVPDGFGIPVSPDDRLHWMPMFNNRGEEAVRVMMKAVVTVIRGKDLKKPLTPLYGSLRSVQVPHLFFVPPGRDERQVTFEAPFNGKIHFLGTHVHPHGVSIELYNVTRREQVWKGTRKNDPNGAMQVYSSAAGYSVQAGETYRITAVYENPTPEKIDAMAGLFMLYSRSGAR